MRISDNQTIAAISTAASPGGIGIVRISGPDAFAAADRIFCSKTGRKKLSLQKSHTIHYGYIYDNGEPVDEVLVSVMRAPHTYTAEDTVEINCHGGVLVTRRVLETVLKNGVRAAEPGEFTKRAFLNGRIDLTRAEAVMDVIAAKNRFALSSSVSQLQGSVERQVRELRTEILDVIAYIEAALDDPEHISLDGYKLQMKTTLAPVYERLGRLSASFEDGRMLSEGIRTVILGKPNAGKSSLLNLFSGRERAIVTDIAGTTRDTLEEQLTIGGIGFMMVDTAGIRDTEDTVEKIGVERARRAAQDADLILYVADTSREIDDDDRQIMKILTGRRCLVLMNKSDLNAKVTKQDIEALCPGFPVFGISAKTGEGLDKLKEAVLELFGRGQLDYNDEVIITNARQKQCMDEALESLHMVLEQLEEDYIPEDLLTIDLMGAYEALGRIIGEEVGEDLVNRIFEKFCMGK